MIALAKDLQHIRRKTRNVRIAAPLESVEQARLMHVVRMHEVRYPALLNLAAVPNGEARHPVVAAKLKAQGVSPGYPDILLDWPAQGFHGLRIELKRQGFTASAIKPAQQAWHARLRAAGYRVEVCGGWEAAWAAISDYLGQSRNI